MAATLVVTITSNDLNINELNHRYMNATNSHANLNALTTLLSAFASGQFHGTVSYTTRDTAPAVATSGAGSKQHTNTH